MGKRNHPFKMRSKLQKNRRYRLLFKVEPFHVPEFEQCKNVALKYMASFKSILLNYDYILVSVISPIAETRRHARLIFKNNYYEVFVRCTLKTLIARDTKGLYEKARKKIIKNLIGYNSNIKYQKTKYKKILINTEKYNLRKSIRIILSKIKKNG